MGMEQVRTHALTGHLDQTELADAGADRDLGPILLKLVDHTVDDFPAVALHVQIDKIDDDNPADIA